MGSRFNGVSISSTRVAPKAALSYDSASSGIRAPLTVDESDFEFSASSKSRRNSTTSSYYSGSEPESEGFASGEDEGILEDIHYVEEYAFSRPFLKNPNAEGVKKISSSYVDAAFRPSVKRPWREIVEESGSKNGDVFGRAIVRNPNDRSFKGLRKVNEYDGSRPLPSDSDEEIFDDGDYVLGNGEFRPVVAAANEDVSENESSSVVDIEISLMPKSIIPIAQISRDSDDDSQTSVVMDDDEFSGVARVPGIEVLQRLDGNRKFSILEVEEVHQSLAENVVDIKFVEELVIGSDCPSSKQEEETIDGIVSADVIQNKGLEGTYKVSDDSQTGVVMDDDEFSGVARVPGIGVLQRLDGNRKFSILEVEEVHQSLAENVVDIKFVEELVVGSDYPSSKQEEQTFDGVVSVDVIQNKGLEDTYKVSSGSLVFHEEHKSLFESEWNGNLMRLDREFEEIDGVDKRKFVALDNHGLPTDLVEDTMLPGNFPCDVTATEPRCPEIVKLMKLEIPELEKNSGIVEVCVDSLVSDKDIQSGNLEQECKLKIDQTETRTSIIIDQDVQMSNGGLSEGCPQFSDLLDALINDKHVSQDAIHKELNSEQLHGEAENPTSQADVNLMVADIEEQGFTPFSSGEILQEIDGQMATGSVEGVNSDGKISDSRQIIDPADLAGCIMDDIGVVSDGGMNQFKPVEAREDDVLPRMNSELEETLSEAQKHKLEIIQQVRLRYLQLLCILGMFPENSIAAKVLYQLAVAEARSSSQEFHFDSDKKADNELEVQSKNDTYFSVSILVIGKTGVGKSATINSIFGERKTVIDAFEPATTEVKEIIGMIDKVKVKIFDTPGLRPSFKDQSHNRKVLLSIKKIMQKSPPDVVLYIDRLDMQTNKFDDLPLLKLVTTILGSSIWQKAIISLTHSSSIPPDGSNGDPVSYELFVSQRSCSVQQMIGHSGGEFLAVNPGLMIPVALVENHTFADKSEYGEKPMHVRESWRSHLLLLCYSMKILSIVNSTARIQNPLDSGNLFGFKICSPFEDDTAADKETGSYETVAVPLKDKALPPSFEGSSQFLDEQDFDSHGWDHNLGYDGQYPAVVSVQLIKDTEEFKIQLRSSVLAKYKLKRSTMAGFDVQTTGVSITFLEDQQITVGERPTLTGNEATSRTQSNAAFRSRSEGCFKGKGYTVVKNQSSLGLSLRNWRGNAKWGCNLQSQFSSGKNSRLHIRVWAGGSKKPSWQISIRTSSSEQLQITIVALLPVAKAILGSFFPRTNKNSS